MKIDELSVNKVYNLLIIFALVNKLKRQKVENNTNQFFSFSLQPINLYPFLQTCTLFVPQ